MVEGPAYGRRERSERATRKRRIGVMGGTFDPIHNGHLVAGSEVAHRFGLDEVMFVPTGQPWQKTGQQAGTARDVSPAEDRYLMTVIATASNPQFSVSRVDIDREGNTYTVDTLRDLNRQLPDAELYFITGADALSRSSRGRTSTSCSRWLASSASAARLRVVGQPSGQAPARVAAGHVADAGDPGAGHLVDGVPCALLPPETGLVPRPRRRRAVHRQAWALPALAPPRPDCLGARVRRCNP